MNKIEKKEWWLYEGEGEQTERKERLKKLLKPVWRDIKKPTYTARTYIPTVEVIEAVNAAIYLRRPLLVTGHPGIGKSTIAKAVAEDLGLGEVLQWHITSKTTLGDGLYSYDALARLQAIQINKGGNSDGGDTSIENYLKLNALGTAFLSTERRVVLIDEIDKSDRDLPNDLLHIFEEQKFEIEELKRLHIDKPKEIKDTDQAKKIKDTDQAKKIKDADQTKKIKDMDGVERSIIKGSVKSENDFPIVIMTSNDEREFSPAFLRRCVCIELKMPDDRQEKIDILTQMVEAHFPKSKGDSTIENIIAEFADKESLHSNDQLLNAIYLVLNSKAKYDNIEESVVTPIG